VIDTGERLAESLGRCRSLDEHRIHWIGGQVNPPNH
jgi:hypothetical protein